MSAPINVTTQLGANTASPLSRTQSSAQTLTNAQTTPIASPATPATLPTPSAPIIVKIVIPNHGLQKALRCLLTDTVWSLKKQLLEKTSNEIPNAFNYGFYLPGTSGRQGKFLEEKRELHSYKFDTPVSYSAL